MFSQTLLAVVLTAISVSAVPNKLYSHAPSAAANGQQAVVAANSNQDGAPVIMHNPYFENDDKHTFDYQIAYKGQAAGPQQIKLFDGQKCLDVKDGVRAPGSKLQLWSCDASNANQQWIAELDGTFRWAGTNLCLDMTDGNPNDGNQLQVWTCDPSNQNQQFGSTPVSTPGLFVSYIQVPSDWPVPSKVFTVPSLTDGAAVSLTPQGSFTDTFPQGTQSWVIPPYSEGVVRGPFKTIAGDKCLDLPNGNTANGTPLQIWACSEGNPNQQWTSSNVDPPKNVRFGNTNKCIEIADGDKIQIADCDGSAKQILWV